MANPGLMFSHHVPDTEPPVGTVAEFRGAFVSGGVTSSGMLVRTDRGWSTSPSGSDPRSWKSLTDLDTMNAAVLERDPNSTAAFGAVRVRIIGHPGNYRPRYVELEAAIYAAAERLSIPTRVFRPGIGTQDFHPLTLVSALENEITAARKAEVRA
jgi:hypothetical protein